MKKSLILGLSLFLIAPFSVNAASYPRVSTLNVTSTDNTINYTGTMETGSHAVMCKLYNEDSEELDLLSSAVENNEFTGSFSNIEDGTYTVYCANYEGGEIKSEEVTVDTRTVITEINLTLTAPTVGTEVKKITNGEDEDQENRPTITIEEGANYEVEGYWIKGTYAELGDGFEEFIDETIVADKDYYAGIIVEPKEGYKLSDTLTIKVNGEEPTETLLSISEGADFISKIKSVEAPAPSSNPQTGDSILPYTILLTISSIGILGGALYIKKNKLIKNK